MSSELVKNKKAYFDYEIIEDYEAGIVLTGGEVKSIKSGGMSLKDSYVKDVGGRLHLVNANISKWPHDQSLYYDPVRARPLLFSKREMEKIALKSAQEGYTLIPLSIYLKKALIKVKVGLGKGRKKYEKKQKIIEREQKRDIRNEFGRI